SSIKHQKKSKLDIEVELCRSFLRLGENATDQDIEDILFFLVDAFNKNNDQQLGYDEVDWDQLTVDVREILCDNMPDSASSDSDQHVILILDKNVQMLPWESLPCLRDQPVSRLPSISFLRDRIMLARHLHRQKDKNADWSDYVVEQNKCFFVLNPSQDLKNTQNEFEAFVKSFKGWDGVIGRTPFEQEIKNGLSDHDLYIYFGHGAGEQYIRNYRVQSLNRCAVTLLLGCSSGHLKDSGEFDPSGTALSYIIAGCPALVANLWDVTDKDIDRFSKALFNNWNLRPNEDGFDVDTNHPVRGEVSLVQA
ncbi:16814_t:CDS:2, partial [Acaulospora morrowiae]